MYTIYKYLLFNNRFINNLINKINIDRYEYIITLYNIFLNLNKITLYQCYFNFSKNKISYFIIIRYNLFYHNSDIYGTQDKIKYYINFHNNKITSIWREIYDNNIWLSCKFRTKYLSFNDVNNNNYIQSKVITHEYDSGIVSYDNYDCGLDYLNINNTDIIKKHIDYYEYYNLKL